MPSPERGRAVGTSNLGTGRGLSRPAQKDRPVASALRCRRNFLRFFPQGFRDETYLAWERDYKQRAHDQWDEVLGRVTFRALLREGKYAEIAAHAVRIESRTNLLFSFEKMALRDAVKSPSGAQSFAEGLYEFLHGPGKLERKFGRWR